MSTPPPAVRPSIPTDPLLYVGIALVVGTLVWVPLGCGPPIPALVGAGALGCLALVAPTRRVCGLALVGGLVLLGLGRAGMAPPTPDGGVAERGLVGVVSRTRGADVEVTTAAGRVVLRQWPAPPEGTWVALRGEARELASVLPGEPAPNAENLRRGRVPVRARWLRRAAGEGARGAESALESSRHAGVLLALARGDRTRLDPGLRALLQRTGTAHLLAISGMHIGLVAGLGWTLGRWLAAPLSDGRHWRVVLLSAGCLSVFLAAAYASIVGWPASAARAVLMVVGAVAARVWGRPLRPWSLLGGAAAALCLVDPAGVEDLGFQLSFLAVAGIVVISPKQSVRRLPAGLRGLASLVLVTLGATAGTLPVVAWRFQEVSAVSPLANLLVGPPVASLVVPGALLVDRLPAAPARLLLWGLDHTLDLCLGVLEMLDCPPLPVAVGPGGAAALILGLLLMRRAPLGSLGIAMMALFLRERTANILEVRFLDIGQGDAALVRWPDGRDWLVDGGPPGDGLLRWLRREGITQLDAVFVSHAHPDHHGGLLPVLAALDVRSLWLPRRPPDPSGALLDLWQAGAAAGALVRVPGDGGPAPVGATVVHPGVGFHATKRRRVNNESLVLQVEHGAHSFLFTGDIEAEAEDWLWPRLSAVTVVKAPHHGSRGSSTSAFAARLRPDWLVVSCGQGNTFGHPHTEALARWIGPRQARTDRDGSIRFVTDGIRLHVEREGADGVVPLQDRPPWRPRPPP